MSCPLCRMEMKEMLSHLATHYKGAVQIGEIIWLNKNEAIYAGRHYRPQSPRPDSNRAQGALVN